MTRVIEQFAEYLTIDKRRQRSTIATYLDEIKRFDIFCNASGNTTGSTSGNTSGNTTGNTTGSTSGSALLTCTRTQVYNYLRQRDIQHTDNVEGNAPLSRNTMSKIISCLQSFFMFCIEEKLIQENPLEHIARPKTEHQIPAVLTQEEVSDILERIDVSTPLGIRDRAMLELIYSCGLRISELTGLQCAHIFSEEGLIRVLGKGDKERIIPMGSYAKYWVNQYLEQVRPLLVQSNILNNTTNAKYALFLNYKGAPINRKGVWKNYKRMLGNTAISTKLHTLRHSFATHLLENGMDLRSVQELLGHENLSTTQIYTNIRTATLQQVHGDFHPRNTAHSHIG